ncbi:vWA domain-containing protein [Salicola sp. Rm-C-2C1-2]|uniref:vWA domain-containing protein n=1 Tax=Salicola sp. Rm-C-2C1-2 TaxID=3141321 RepID=UPI0032E3D3E0
MRQGTVLLVLLAGLMLGGCSDNSDTPDEAGNSKPADFTLASAVARTWPDAGDEPDPERLDTQLTRANYMVVLDMSGSMATPECAGSHESKAHAAKAAMERWLAGVPDEANLGLIVFGQQGTSIRTPLGRNNRDPFLEAVHDASPEGGTPLQSAVAMAHQELERGARRQRGYGTYRLVVITDGEHSQGEDPRKEVGRIAGHPANPIEIHTLGFCIEDSALNQPGTTIYRSAQNPEQLAQGLDSVLAESRTFVPTKEFAQDDL